MTQASTVTARSDWQTLDLSIIDIEGGHQPQQNEEGTVHVTYNGEIYNFQPLRAELEKQDTSSPQSLILKSSFMVTSSSETPAFKD